MSVKDENPRGMSSSEVRIIDPVTGGAKGSKPERHDLIPWGFATDEVSRVYAFGASKYADHNWRKGYAWSLSIAALLRHIFAWIRGETCDPESGLHHLAHAVFHLFALMTYQHENLGTDDRYISSPVPREPVVPMLTAKIPDSRPITRADLPAGLNREEKAA